MKVTRGQIEDSLSLEVIEEALPIVFTVDPRMVIIF